MQLLWIKALFLDKAGRAASLTFLGIIIGYFSDYVAFNYTMQPSEIIGSLLILSCSVSVFALKIYNYSD